MLAQVCISQGWLITKIHVQLERAWTYTAQMYKAEALLYSCDEAEKPQLGRDPLPRQRGTKPLLLLRDDRTCRHTGRR